MTSPEQQLRHALATRLETPPGQHYSEVMRRYAPNSAGSDDEFMYFYYALFQTFLGPGNRSGPLAVGVVACCSGGRWTTIQRGWRTSF